MKTPSHFLITAAIDQVLPRVPIHRAAFLWGAIAPDIPLWGLSLGGIVYYHFWLGWSLVDTFHLMFDQLYFHNPFWLALHNALHAPLVLLGGSVLVWKKRRNISSIHRWVFWFLIACAFHSLIDILTHVDDGPLLFFPLNWSLRFHSPVSYWDPRYYGKEFQVFELILDGICLVYLMSKFIRYRLRRDLLVFRKRAYYRHPRH